MLSNGEQGVDEMNHIDVDHTVLFDGNNVEQDTPSEFSEDSHIFEEKISSGKTAEISTQEKISIAKEKNRVHAQKTRQRKKDFVESLKETIKELSKDRERLDRERKVTTARLLETASVRKRVLREVLSHRVLGNLDSMFWSNVLDEKVEVVLPITPYRSFPPSEVKDGERRIVGVNAVIMDVASLSVMFQSLVPPYTHNSDRIHVEVVCDLSSAVLSQDIIMTRWQMKTTNAVAAGCAYEIHLHGMLKASFSVTNKLTNLELVFDVMSMMQQLRRASHRNDFAIIPNTYQLALERVTGPKVITDSLPPYPIIYVSPEWEEMFGYSAQEVVGQTCKILQGPLTEAFKIEEMMRFVRVCLPTTTVVHNYHKNGEVVKNWIRIYPLFADQSVRYFIGQVERVPETWGPFATNSKVDPVKMTRFDHLQLSLNRQYIDDNTNPLTQLPQPHTQNVLTTDCTQLASGMSGISRAYRQAQTKKDASLASSTAATTIATTTNTTSSSVSASTSNNAMASSRSSRSGSSKANNINNNNSSSAEQFHSITFSKHATNVLYPAEVLSSLPRFPSQHLNDSNESLAYEGQDCETPLLGSEFGDISIAKSKSSLTSASSNRSKRRLNRRQTTKSECGNDSEAKKRKQNDEFGSNFERNTRSRATSLSAAHSLVGDHDNSSDEVLYGLFANEFPSSEDFPLGQVDHCSADTKEWGMPSPPVRRKSSHDAHPRNIDHSSSIPMMLSSVHSESYQMGLSDVEDGPDHDAMLEHQANLFQKKNTG